jgi:hypothetical protein
MMRLTDVPAQHDPRADRRLGVRDDEPLIVDPVLGADEHRSTHARGQRRLADADVGGVPRLDTELRHLTAGDPRLGLTNIVGVEERMNRAARDVLDVDTRALAQLVDEGGIEPQLSSLSRS